MAQNGFALFFLAVLIGCTFALTAWVRLHWTRIVAAARGDMLAEPRIANYTAVQRRPIDVPYVAQRMLPTVVDGHDARGVRSSPWRMPNARPRGKQLVFGF